MKKSGSIFDITAFRAQLFYLTLPSSPLPSLPFYPHHRLTVPISPPTTPSASIPIHDSLRLYPHHLLPAPLSPPPRPCASIPTTDSRRLYSNHRLSAPLCPPPTLRTSIPTYDALPSIPIIDSLHLFPLSCVNSNNTGTDCWAAWRPLSGGNLRHCYQIQAIVRKGHPYQRHSGLQNMFQHCLRSELIEAD
ncbi:hypothetical protein PoB_007602600 [Plakobranchus ocellatus]|uniref:Uncharacterized protein n=1 Tax=Plakobranchus ocellatus TaxID=259542 RepID=A0AAV4DZM8_9GAST|nr:hypothetical protein PoB_007602600 [Plakobranchus ocellatus]